MPENKPLDRVIFGTADQSVTARDVLDWAFATGELDPHWKRLLTGVEAERMAAEQELEVEQDTLNSEAEEFRYAHDLITAEETERWLEERSVTLRDFAAFHSRYHWRTLFGDKAKPQPTDFATASPELHEALVTDLIFSDQLDKIASRMSWRIAAGKSPEQVGIDEALLEPMRGEFYKRASADPGKSSNAVTELGRDDNWLTEQLRMEACYKGVADMLLTPQARERELSNLRLPLTRFDLETIELDSQDAAREAMFCVNEDGMSMEEVAKEGRYPYRRAHIVLEDIAEELQQRFLNVRDGALIEPIPRGEGVELCRVIEKAEPNPEDESVRKRIEARILNRHFGELTAKHIIWSLIRPE